MLLNESLKCIEIAEKEKKKNHIQPKDFKEKKIEAKFRPIFSFKSDFLYILTSSCA